MSMSSSTKEINEFRITDPSKPVRILQKSSDKTASIDPITVPGLMKRTAENYPNNTALMYKDEVSKEWKGISYKEYRERVEKMAKVFIKLGLERHGTVAVLAFNSVEWFVSELAAIHAGGIIAGVYTTNSVESCLHVLESSTANIVIVDDQKQMDKIYQIKDKLPHLKAVVQTQPPYAQYIRREDGYWRWSELEDMTIDAMVTEEYLNRSRSIAANECCCLVYTSGTVGNPKGVMLSHDNFTWTAYSFTVHVDNLTMGNEVLVSYLPLSHVAAQIMDLFIVLTIAGTIYFADRNAMKGSLVQTLMDARPTHFLAVPRIYEKIQEKIVLVSAQSGVLKQLVGSWAMNVTLEHHLARMAGRSSNSLQYKLAKKITAKVKQALGFDRVKNFITGAAPLSSDTKKYFMSLDIPIIEAFGMSESTGGHSMSSIEQTTFETIGKSLPGVETKIIKAADDGSGEVCVKGRHIFMGYISEVEKTAEAIDDDGWLHTGDVGYIDRDGFIFITGRIKELIITAGGENISPVLIEENVKAQCISISNALLVGDKRKFLTILITLKTVTDSEGVSRDELSSETLNWLQGMNLNYKTLTEVLETGPDPKVLQAIQRTIDQANKKAISNAQKIQKFAILPQDFSILTGELGPTMKLKRNVVLEKYNDIIDKFYN